MERTVVFGVKKFLLVPLPRNSKKHTYTVNSCVVFYLTWDKPKNQFPYFINWEFMLQFSVTETKTFLRLR